MTKAKPKDKVELRVLSSGDEVELGAEDEVLDFRFDGDTVSVLILRK